MNMFGAPLSDVTSELSGSLGLGGTLNAGAEHAMGQDVANPFSLVLSAAQLPGWHGRRTGRTGFTGAGQAIEAGVAACIADGRATRDVGGRLGTAATGAALAEMVGATQAGALQGQAWRMRGRSGCGWAGR